MDAHELALSTIGMPAGVSVRLNPFKPSRAPLDAEKVPWCEWGYQLKDRPVFTLDPLFHAGAYYVQDSSAMYVGKVFRDVLDAMGNADGSPVSVLDLCAAPGGKTTDLAASLRLKFGDAFRLVSNEVIRQRCSALCDNVALWGDPAVTVTCADPAAFSRAAGAFDVVLADVPCSGEGMFRKDPRAVKEWSADVVRLCAERQRRILSAVWPSLKEGGYLIYSTCTFEEAENDDNLEWAAGELGGSILPLRQAPDGVTPTRFGHMLVPGRVPGEGQWVGVLRKTSPVPAGAADGLSLIRPVRQGIRKGEMKGNSFVPSADYALSIFFDREEYPCVEVDRHTALAYLHRDSIVLPDAPAGFVAVCYEGLPLGFVKNLGRRCNNLLPQGRRILMDIDRNDR